MRRLAPGSLNWTDGRRYPGRRPEDTRAPAAALRDRLSYFFFFGWSSRLKGACLKDYMHETHTGVCEKENALPEKKAGGNISFKNTESGTEEHFLPLCCKEKAHRKGVLFHRHRYYTWRHTWITVNGRIHREQNSNNNHHMMCLKDVVQCHAESCWDHRVIMSTVKAYREVWTAVCPIEYSQNPTWGSSVFTLKNTDPYPSRARQCHTLSVGHHNFSLLALDYGIPRHSSVSTLIDAKHIYIYIYTHMYVCVYVYIYI